jgi:hypothetical protein
MVHAYFNMNDKSEAVFHGDMLCMFDPSTESLNNCGYIHLSLGKEKF